MADVLIGAAFIENWKVSDLLPGKSLQDARYPETPDLHGWHSVKCLSPNQIAAGFVSAKPIINRQAGMLYLVSDIEVGPTDRGTLFLGYDGPVRVWVNGLEVFIGMGTNPAVPDKTVVDVRFRHGRNRIAIALDTNQGQACGIYARYDITTGTKAASEN